MKAGCLGCCQNIAFLTGTQLSEAHNHGIVMLERQLHSGYKLDSKLAAMTFEMRLGVTACIAAKTT